MALENNENCIIAVPNVALVTNKCEQYPNKRFNGKVLGLYETKGDAEISKYLSEIDGKQPIKIIVTYDSIYKAAHLLDRCCLIIDECNQLFNLIGLKVKGKDCDCFNYLMNLAEQYKDKVSFISATPIPIEYFEGNLKWVQDLPQYRFEFSNICKSTMLDLKRSYPFKALKDEIITPLKRDGIVRLTGSISFSKVIVYINSVKNITKVIKECQLDKSDVAILCGNSVKNDCKIKGYKRIEKYNELPKYTFITSSGFQGIDLYDTDAMNVVVSNTKSNHTMIDLLTDLQQAISRNRCKNNPNYSKFIFIYNQSVFAKSENELLTQLENTKTEILTNCQLLNRLSGDEYNATLNRFKDSNLFTQYALYINDIWQLNSLKFKADEYFITQTRRQFSKGFDLPSSATSTIITIEPPKTDNSLSYAALIDKYKSSLNDTDVIFTDAEKATEYYQIIDTYYQYYNGFDLNITRAKDMIKSYKNDWLKIYNNVRWSLKIGRYKATELKKMVQKIYNDNGINRKFNYTDLNELNISYHTTTIKGYKYIYIDNKR